MRTALGELGLEGRIGVNTGEVVTGTPERLVAGDAVNVAARLQQAASPGQILLGSETHVLVADAVRVKPVEPLALKGKSEPVAVYRVLGPERRASPRGGPKIVGRETELAQLYAYYREAIAGRGQLVHVHGEAGVGKTRLIGELLSGLPRGTTRVRARASSYEQATPYALVAELVRRMLAIGPTDEVFRQILPGGIFRNPKEKLRYYELTGGINVLPGELFFWTSTARPSALYLIVGLGSTNFLDQRHFTATAGFGLRAWLANWVSLQVDMRDHIFSLDVLGQQRSTQNLEFSGGVTFFF